MSGFTECNLCHIAVAPLLLKKVQKLQVLRADFHVIDHSICVKYECIEAIWCNRLGTIFTTFMRYVVYFW